ncbi:hypothetical protein HMPREF1545_01375 [Oscillibacter sp. KLE 1728]|nr:hypothetical protein HMPREF1545_01375 [Oscillibacter sp. KLE 1728]
MSAMTRGESLSPESDPACAGQHWQSCLSFPGLKAVETFGMCP